MGVIVSFFRKIFTNNCPRFYRSSSHNSLDEIITLLDNSPQEIIGPPHNSPQEIIRPSHNSRQEIIRLSITREDEDFLRNLLETSPIASDPHKLECLATDLVSQKQFNCLRIQLKSEHFTLSSVCFQLISYWMSYKGHEATLSNFEQILRRHELTADAGELKAI